MKAQTVEQVELFTEAELESLDFVPEELEAIEQERVPNLESISFEDIAEDLEANLKRKFLNTVGKIKRKLGRKKRPLSSSSTLAWYQPLPLVWWDTLSQSWQPRENMLPRPSPDGGLGSNRSGGASS